MTTWGIYKVTCTVNNKVYIGLTSKKYPSERWNQHKYAARKGANTQFHRAIRKYKEENFQWEIIEKGIPTLVEAGDREIFYISKFDSYHNGYNRTLGGHYATTIVSPLKHFDKYTWVHKEYGIEIETISGMSQKYGLVHSALSVVAKGLNKHFKGWQIYREGKDLVIPFQDIAVQLYHKNGDMITVTRKEFSETFNVPLPQVHKLYNGGCKSLRGWATSVSNITSNLFKKVYMYDLEGVLFATFSTSYECSTYLGYKKKRVSGWLASRDFYIDNGYLFTYKADLDKLAFNAMQADKDRDSKRLGVK